MSNCQMTHWIMKQHGLKRCFYCNELLIDKGVYFNELLKQSKKQEIDD